ncbi:MAG TPA: FAD-dependent oxidoreductase [Campylobacterales bacterium]|nr:FAD-dependent oxidoreductase [Arcobacter sp.]HHB94257.1 FAD-dependent oxidoreductase [Campylobacterales bacterium]
MRVAIIGAGFSGCFLARQLEKKNIDVTLFEKSRGVGGRMATRYDKDFSINHGCANIIPTRLDFKVFCEELVNKDLLYKQESNHYKSNEMNRLLKYLTQNVKVIKNTLIKKVSYSNGKYMLRDQHYKNYSNFDFLFLTIPSKQIIELDILLEDKVQKKLNNVSFDSIVTLALYGNEVQYLDTITLSSMKHLHKLYIQDSKTLIIHMDRAFSNQYNHLNQEMLKPLVINEIQKVFPPFQIEKYQHFIHLWKYGLTHKAYGEPFIYNKKKHYALCADWLLGDSVEDAYHSVNAFLNAHASHFS